MCLKPRGTLVSLEIAARPWISIILDFIVELPSFVGHAIVLIVIDQLTKMVHFILCDHLPLAEAMAQLLVMHIVHLHELLDQIISA